MVATQIYVFYVVPYLGFFDSRGWITPLSHSHICTGFGIWGPFIWWILALQPWPFCWSSDVSFVAYPFVACGTWDNKNRRPCHAGKRKFKRNLQEIAVRLAGRDFCWDPCLTIIFLRVPAEFVFLFFFNMFNHHGPWVLEPPGGMDSQLPRLNLCWCFSSFVKTEKKLLVRPAPKKKTIMTRRKNSSFGRCISY